MTISSVFSNPCALLSINKFCYFTFQLLLVSELLSPRRENCTVTLESTVKKYY